MATKPSSRSPLDSQIFCPICRDPVARSLPANIAPFVRIRCMLPFKAEARSHFCEACEHVFLTPLLTESQVSKLYDDYRGLNYDAERIFIEPTYAEVNKNYTNLDSEYYQYRRDFYDRFCIGGLTKRQLVVDASDGTGYFARYMFPFADVVTLPHVGIPPGVDLQKLLAKADVLTMALRLQGVPDPLETLRRLSAGLRTGTKVWIETPVEYFGGLRAAYETLESRVSRGVQEHGPLQTLHDHLAHFSIRSLRRLLARAEILPLEFFHSSFGILGVVGRIARDEYAVASHD